MREELVIGVLRDKLCYGSRKEYLEEFPKLFQMDVIKDIGTNSDNKLYYKLAIPIVYDADWCAEGFIELEVGNHTLTMCESAMVFKRIRYGRDG